MKAEQRLLKSKLEIKRQLKYVEKNAIESKEKYNIKDSENGWKHMADAYKIALDILEGKEL